MYINFLSLVAYLMAASSERIYSYIKSKGSLMFTLCVSAASFMQRLKEQQWMHILSSFVLSLVGVSSFYTVSSYIFFIIIYLAFLFFYFYVYNSVKLRGSQKRSWLKIEYSMRPLSLCSSFTLV